MSESYSAKSYSEEQFSCSVCLDVLKEPVTIPCGHSYCMSCIDNFWSGFGENAVYTCPQCRETFSPRPALNKNTLVAEVLEKMKDTSDLAAISNQNTSACAKLECDFCIGAKSSADKFCLQCLASYCELHLQPHYESPVFMKHKLVPASAQLQKNICFHHGKLLDIYCCDDRQCICYLCTVETHKGHELSSVESVRIKNEAALEKTKLEFQQMIAQREESLTDLTKAVTSVKLFVQTAEEDCEAVFSELIKSMSRRCSEVKTLIRAQEKAELSRAEELRQRLDRELAELRARIAEIQQLLSMNDNIDFIRKVTSVRSMPMFKDLSSITHNTSGKISILRIKEYIEDVCEQEVARISKEDDLQGLFGNSGVYLFKRMAGASILETSPILAVMNIHVVEPLEPETREDFLQYFCDLHVDPNTINNSLCLSEGDRKVTLSHPALPYPYHPERFDQFPYVLCKEGLDGRCYWEADCSGNDCCVAVSYKGIKRKGCGVECRFGFNDKSWRLFRSDKEYHFRHNKIATSFRQFSVTTIGVYLNHGAGTLSFYSVSDQMTLLHKVQTIFTEPLYAGFGVGRGSVIRIREKKNKS